MHKTGWHHDVSTAGGLALQLYGEKFVKISSVLSLVVLPRPGINHPTDYQKTPALSALVPRLPHSKPNPTSVDQSAEKCSPIGANVRIDEFGKRRL
jgi:hypothetical protein